MKKITVVSILVVQLILNPSLLHAGILESPDAKKSDLIPETHAVGTAENQTNDMNHVLALVAQSAESAMPTRTLTLSLSPLASDSLTVTVDESARTATLLTSPSASPMSGSFDPATLKATVGFAGMQHEMAFVRQNNQLQLSSLVSQINTGSLFIRVSYQFSNDQQVLGYAMDFSTASVKQHLEVTDAGAGQWKAAFSSTDQNSKTLDFYQGFLNSADVQNLGNSGVDAQIRKIQEKALTRITFSWGTELYAHHSEKNAAGGWDIRSKTTFATGLKTFIAGAASNGGEALFVQDQTVPGWPGYQVTFGESWAGDGRYEGYGLIFTSASQKIIVDYPRTNVVDLEGKTYRIQLNAAGQISLEEAVSSPDFNQDGKTDDIDVDLIYAAFKENRFETRFDLNKDGALNRADVKIISDRFVEELKKTNFVFIADPYQANALNTIRDSVRTMTANGMTQNVIVLIPEGDYYSTAFELDARDSGQNGFQITYRGYPGQEMPKIMGGKKLEPSAWQRATELPGNVYKMDLNVSGVAPEVNALFVNGKAAVNSESGELAVVDVPTVNNLLTLFPTATQNASWDGTKTILRTYLPDDGSGYNLRPLREEHFFGLNLTLAEINARRAADPNGLTFRPDHIDSYAQFIFDPVKMLAGMNITANMTPQQVQEAKMALQGALAEVWSYGFHMNQIRIKDVDWNTNTVTLDGPTLWTMEKNLSNGVYAVAGVHAFNDVHEDYFVIRNSKSFLSEGEYFYSGGVVYYKAASGETMANKTAVIPTTKQTLSVKGTETAPVHDIVFDRLDISVSQAVKEFKNNTIGQDYYFLPEEMSAFYLKNTRNITIRNSVIHDTGAVGLLLDGISVENKILNNKFLHLGADGIVINGDKIPPTNTRNKDYRPTLLSHDNVISGNEIAYTGDVFPKSDGIRIVQSANNVVSGNNIHHIGFSGIFLIGMQEYLISTRTAGKSGITRDKDAANYDVYYEFNLAKNNQFLNNEISNICLYSDDGAAFYTHSAGKNNVISGNNIHDIYHGHNIPPLNVYWVGAYGIYLDGGQSDYFTITNNRITNVNDETGMPMTINGSHNTITGNYTEQKNSNAPIQFISGYQFAQRGNVVEHNTFKNLDPKGTLMMRLWQYLTYPYKEGMTIPAGAFVVNKKTKASDPDNKVLYVPANTFSSNDYNTYDFASHKYFIQTDWSDLTTFVPDASKPGGGYQQVLLKAYVPHTDWRTAPLAGYTRAFDEHSLFKL